jgi:hypothetical protein
MQNLEVMTISEACKTKTRYFRTKRACKECWSRRKYLITFTQNQCVCVGCCPNPWEHTSTGQMNAELRSVSKRIKKAERNNWTIPVVFGGYNTCTK